MKKSLSLPLILIMFTVLGSLTGCSSEAFIVSEAANSGANMDNATDNDTKSEATHLTLPVGTYDSADTAILENVDREKHEITLYNTYASKTYTLVYDDTTYVTDKYGTAMSMAQLKEGQIVNVNFLKSDKQLVDIQVSTDAWTYDDVTKYDLGGINQTASIGNRTYALTDGVQVFSQGENADLMSIVDGDVLSISGLGTDIYSIRVESGHGYVRLDNAESLVGGWIEIGKAAITKVSENMLIPVPEGDYHVRMYNDYSEVDQDITVERNQEVILDCSGITAPEDMSGKILFNITPNTATLYLDGEQKDYSTMVQTTYGVHQIEVQASGYDTLSKYINVGTDIAQIDVIMEKTKTSTASGNTTSSTTDSTTSTTSPVTTTTTTTSGNKSTVSGNTSVSTTSSTNKVYISAPTDVEVYLDGVYVGTSPVTFNKQAGNHTIILKKSGYVTKSYSLYLYDDGKDIAVSYSDLEKESTTTDSSSTTGTSSASSTTTVSGNTSSSNSSELLDEEAPLEE